VSTQAIAGLALLALAALLANLPFVSERIFGLIGRGERGKGVAIRFGELLVLYLIMLLLARGIESRFGPIYPQHWEFYGITACLFIVLAYPGFVWRYLSRRATAGQASSAEPTDGAEPQTGSANE
jgi:hypothetical protein